MSSGQVQVFTFCRSRIQSPELLKQRPNRQIKLQRDLPSHVRIPNALTTRTLKAGKAGKNVKRFGRRKELCADLGL